ncbi:dickkopf-related protein 3-like [Diadema antillarum]|uniref:dickkopf-related protein 3-like n=1 Tax=Diadema antillarum TaxID=105358 RepID=UPI003A8AC93D
MVRVTNIACPIIALLTLIVGQVDAYVWSWMWGGPYPQGEGPQSPGSDGVPVTSDLGLNHPRNLHSRIQVNESEARYYENVPCESDKMCGRGRFCDFHYGGCHRHREQGQQCRRDGHCQKGHDCMFGTCHLAIPERTLGARCRNDKDCGESMCCARQHGESVCKRKLPLNAKCYIPQGGVEYVIDTMCPCEAGLICRETMVMERREQEFVLKFWTDRDHMRCQPR